MSLLFVCVDCSPVTSNPLSHGVNRLRLRYGNSVSVTCGFPYELPLSNYHKGVLVSFIVGSKVLDIQALHLYLHADSVLLFMLFS